MLYWCIHKLIIHANENANTQVICNIDTLSGSTFRAIDDMFIFLEGYINDSNSLIRLLK